MAGGDGVTLATSAPSSGSNAPSGGNNPPPNKPGHGEKKLKTSQNRCQRCSQSHLRCSISQTGAPCDFCRRNNIQCAPAVLQAKGVKLGTKRGSYKKTKSKQAEASNSPSILPAASDTVRNEILPEVQNLKRALANLNTILDGPSPKKSRHTEDGQRPAARLESLSTSSTMHSRPGQIPTLANHNPINRTPLPSRREHLPSSGSFIGASTATTSNTNASSQALSTTASRYGQPSRLSTIDDDDNYDCDEEEEEEEEEVFYDSSPFFPSMTSPTSTSAGAETRSHGGDRHTTFSSREFSHLSSFLDTVVSDDTDSSHNKSRPGKKAAK
ncbi:hypothetical protein L207DRAFT_606686 [Hyaloscypha variabilis F]|uniref:Zn(2)-C6 fungal-type domain-containing protein n=1 Tax=Hyaloscypha variabilis (strain UAMH 11265 / GT02V1 / F) TaxID=1149755 RepID=A0A2J6S9L9_HYAVF|nr:hypothetical protein L207DRAFT_606686 [Hyaloscypha variabilis F]